MIVFKCIVSNNISGEKSDIMKMEASSLYAALVAMYYTVSLFRIPSAKIYCSSVIKLVPGLLFIT